MSSGTIPEVTTTREKLLNCVMVQVTNKWWQEMEEEPIGKEIWKILKKLPKSKVLGIDSGSTFSLLDLPTK